MKYIVKYKHKDDMYVIPYGDPKGALGEASRTFDRYEDTKSVVIFTEFDKGQLFKIDLYKRDGWHRSYNSGEVLKNPIKISQIDKAENGLLDARNQVILAHTENLYLKFLELEWEAWQVLYELDPTNALLY